MNRIIMIVVVLLCFAPVQSDGQIADNQNVILKLLSLLEEEVRDSYQNKKYDFFKNGSYLKTIEKLLQYQDEELQQVAALEISITKKKFIEIAINRRAFNSRYNDIANIYDVKPETIFQNAVWSHNRLSVDKEFISKDYVLVWEERLLCPHIGEGGFLYTKFAIALALEQLGIIHKDSGNYLEFLRDLYIYACERKKPDGGIIRKYLLLAIGKYQEERAIKVLNELYNKNNRSNEKDFILNMASFEGSFRDLSLKLKKTVDPDTDLGIFLKKVSEVIALKKENKWNPEYY